MMFIHEKRKVFMVLYDELRIAPATFFRQALNVGGGADCTIYGDGV
jgi:hypothetical protein